MTADHLLAKAQVSKGLVFIREDDWEYLFKDGTLIAEGHSLDAKLVLDALAIPHRDMEHEPFDSEEEGWLFQTLAERTNPNVFRR